MIVKLSKTQEIMKKYEIKPKKKYGQNFLVDANILKKIIAAAKIAPNDIVIEIGPGLGALTEALAKVAKQVIAYEIDKDFIDILEDVLGDYNNIQIVNKDFLKANLTNNLNLSGNNRVLVVSNLPYYITTPIIFNILENEIGINECYFMVQKEVGERLTAIPGSKEYGALSVLMAYKTNTRILFEVSRNCFFPKPNVESVIVEIKRKTPIYKVIDEERFLLFIRNIFAFRRKTLLNNIIASYPISKGKIQSALLEHEINLDVRSESLDLSIIYNLYQTLFESPNA